MSCLRSISSSVFFGWFASELLRLSGGGPACVAYHLCYGLLNVWDDRDTEIEYDAIQVNHNHDYRSSVQANYVGYPRFYHGLVNVNKLHVAYAVLSSLAWFGTSCGPGLGLFGSCTLSFCCIFLPGSLGYRFVFSACFLVLVRESVVNSVEVEWSAMFRALCFFLCFVMDRLRCLPAQAHFLCAVLLFIFCDNYASFIVLLPAMAPLVFCREVLHAQPLHLLVFTVLFLSIITLNQ